MAARTKTRKIAPYDERREALEKRLEALMEEEGRRVAFQIEPLNEKLGTSPAMDTVEGMVISRDMVPEVDRFQAVREAAGQRPLEIFVADELLASDGLPIRATRVSSGEIDAEGRILGTVMVGVGTANPTKVEAVRRVFERIYPGGAIQVTPVEVDSGVPDQPSDDQVLEGARTRARAAMDELGGSPHFAVGVEAGLFWKEEGEPTFDVQYCAVVDRGGRMTEGHGPGFVYPDTLLEEVKGGKQVRDVMVERYWKEPPERGKGAVFTFSAELMDRLTLTEQAVLMAMIPRISGEHGF
jgi:inosine/xanthosine triphosphatase